MKPPQELCGEDTPKGPCTMPKNHDAAFHRHREYDRVEWEITSRKVPPKILAKGVSRVPLQYAISDALTNHDSIAVYIKKG